MGIAGTLHALVTPLVILLFISVAGLIAYGALSFSGDSASTAEGVRHVNMRLEVLWTGLAASLLLGIFVYAH